jgi:hypothetical protein
MNFYAFHPKGWRASEEHMLKRGPLCGTMQTRVNLLQEREACRLWLRRHENTLVELTALAC